MGKAYDRAVFWLALAFFLVAIFGSLAYAAVRGWRLWRIFSATSRRANDALAKVTVAATAAEAHANALTGGTERLAAAAESLQEALAELQTISAAAAEPLALIGAVRGAVPRK